MLKNPNCPSIFLSTALTILSKMVQETRLLFVEKSSLTSYPLRSKITGVGEIFEVVIGVGDMVGVVGCVDCSVEGKGGIDGASGVISEIDDGI